LSQAICGWAAFSAFRDVVDDLDKVVIKVLDLGGGGKRYYGKHGSIRGKENGNPDTGDGNSSGGVSA